MLKILKASAGSGKTYTLVREYLALALRSPKEHFKKILALTFTNKAANEMKSRVLERLNGIADLKDEEKAMINFLCDKLEISPTELQMRCSEMLQSMLHHYADIAICTIDSFTHQVIKGFAYELKLSMNIEIEMDSEALLTQVVDILLDEIEDEKSEHSEEEKKQLSKALIEFASTKLDENKSWEIEKELTEFSKNLLRDETFLHRETLEKTSIPALLQLQKDLQQFIKKFETQSDKIALEAIRLISGKGLKEEDFWQKGRGIIGYFRSIHEKGANYDNPTGSSFHWRTIHEEKWNPKPEIESIKEQLKNYFLKLTKMYETEYPEVALAKLISKNIFPFMLLQAINKTLQSYKQDNNLMLIGEFQHRVFSEVKDQPIPVIFERVGGKYENIMIDEFQDTSVMQWHNLLPLIDNAVSNMNECLIVGDAKQAIYRFRGGEVKQFSMLPEIYGSEKDWVLKEREINIINHKPKEENLEFNFRSRENIIQFNNRFYEMAKALPELTDKATYLNHSQKNGSKKQGGNVMLTFVEGNKEEKSKEQLERVYEFVQDALKRGYQKRDIAVLTEKNKTGTAIASFLIHKGLSVVSRESLIIAEAPSVQLLECALMYLYRTEDKILRAELLLSLREKFQTNIFAENIPVHGNCESFEATISQIIQEEFSSKKLNNLRLFDLLNKLTNLFKLNIGNDPFVQFFLDEVLLFSEKFSGNIQHFLDWWEGEKEKKSIIYPETLNAINIMTVHKSKGLEFPVVILPDADYSTLWRNKQTWVEIDKPYCKGINEFLLPIEKSLEGTSLEHIYTNEQNEMFLEKLNLLYVATTRPTDLLYIITKKASENKKEPKRINNLSELFHQFAESEKPKVVDEKMLAFFDDQTTPLKEEKKKHINTFNVSSNITVSGNSTLSVRKNKRIFWKQSKLDDIEFGVLLHEFLSQLNYAEEFEEKFKKFTAKENLNKDLQGKLYHEASAFVHHPELKRFFMKPYKVFNETGLLFSGSLRYADRVVLDESNHSVSIIEYKTGDVNSKHKEQLKTYAEAFQSLGIRVEKALLFYTQQNQLTTLDH